MIGWLKRWLSGPVAPACETELEVLSAMRVEARRNLRDFRADQARLREMTRQLSLRLAAEHRGNGRR